jgi:hypothetical protein
MLFFTLGVSLLTIGLKRYSQQPKPPKTDLMIISGIALMFLVFYFIYYYIKNSPRIFIDRKTISFNKDQFAIDNIMDITFSGKHSFLLSQVEGVKIQFKNGEVKYIFDLFYNYHLLKQYLQHIITSQESFNPYMLKSTKGVNPQYLNSYRGTFILSFRGLIFIMLCAPMLFIAIYKNNSTLITFSALFSVFFYFIIGTNVYFIGLSNHYLVVNNHLLFWINHIYNLSDISEVVYETQGKQPNCIRIITRDYKSKYYGAGTLSSNTLRRLKKQLEKQGIPVRDELYLG